MELKDYPKYTIIMRNYSFSESEAILKAMKGFEQSFAVEMTLNTPNAIKNIEKLNNLYGDKIKIGAGTVRSLEDVKAAISVGAKFLLGPHDFSSEMIKTAKKENVLVIPSGMTPTEINNMFDAGADIVKVFPANLVNPIFFKDIQAPLGNLPLMAVGGINQENAKDYLDQNTSYLGIGSGLFNKSDIKDCHVTNLANSLKNFLESVQEVK